MFNLVMHCVVHGFSVVSVCVCVDIQVGFESSEYTVDEGSDLESQVFITKFDGVSTEEDIDIQITVIPQTTQIGTKQSSITHRQTNKCTN